MEINLPKIMFYPVGNGDMTLIVLNDQSTILIDCNIRQNSTESKDTEIYDVKSDLLQNLQRKNGNPYLDVHILTHGDQDHCRGYSTHFYKGDPKKYSDINRKNNEIIIDEMWFSPMVAEENTNNDEDAHQAEAERRLELHQNNHTDKDLPGNRIKIIGYDSNKDYSNLDHLRVVPGNICTTFNYKTQDSFSVFIHAPFKEQLMPSEKDKNSTSIVFQARFKENSTDKEFTCLAMFGGDSDHYSWDIILDKTIKHQNDLKEMALSWDLFLSPHHCSWSFFNDRPQAENPTPKENSLKVLDYRRKGGKVIASSKKIIDDDDNPPHYKAKKEYIKKLDSSSDFLNTAVEPKESAPEPIVFIITKDGPQRLTKAIVTASQPKRQPFVPESPWCNK